MRMKFVMHLVPFLISCHNQSVDVDSWKSTNSACVLLLNIIEPKCRLKHCRPLSIYTLISMDWLTTLGTARANQPVHWFLGVKGLGIQKKKKKNSGLWGRPE